MTIRGNAVRLALLGELYARFKLRQLGYLEQQAEFLQKIRAPRRTLQDIWNGDGTNTGAMLTVYRHAESAFVFPGATGGLPKAARGAGLSDLRAHRIHHPS